MKSESSDPVFFCGVCGWLISKGFLLNDLQITSSQTPGEAISWAGYHRRQGTKKPPLARRRRISGIPGQARNDGWVARGFVLAWLRMSNVLIDYDQS